MNVEPTFPRETPELERREVEERLFAELDANAKQYSKDEDFGRRAAREAILTVLNSLLDRGLSSQAAKIFGDVAEAFSDVEKGILPEIFDPNAGKKAGREGGAFELDLQKARRHIFILARVPKSWRVCRSASANDGNEPSRDF